MKKPASAQQKLNSSKGGKTGGAKRAASLTPQQRSSIAAKGAAAKNAKGK
jgi:hypothetical protein